MSLRLEPDTAAVFTCAVPDVGPVTTTISQVVATAAGDEEQPEEQSPAEVSVTLALIGAPSNSGTVDVSPILKTPTVSDKSKDSLNLGVRSTVPS